MAGSSGPMMYWGRTHYPLYRLAVRCQTVAISSCDTASQDALNGAAVELFEYLTAHSKSFQPHEGEEAFFTTVLVCVNHDNSLVM